MRARNIKPGFFANEILAECSFAARLLFPGLWMLADREGRLEDRPKRIKGQIFAFDDIDVGSLLAELADRGFITRYSVDGRALIQVTEFGKHQHPHRNETASTIPGLDRADTGSLRSKAGSTSDHGAKCSGSAPVKARSTPADSLIPDSLIPDSPLPPKGGKGSKTLPPIPESLDTPKFRAAWEEWQTHKREKRSSVTPTSAKRLFASLEKLGPARAIAAIEHSIERGWQSVSEPSGFERKPAGAGTDAVLKSFVENGVHP